MLIRFLLLLILGIIVARVFRSILANALAAGAPPPRDRKVTGRGVQMVRDPVCGTFLPPAGALTASERGTIQYFCSETCRNQYASRQRPA